MKNLDALRHFYQRDLLGELQRLEQQRLDVAKKLTLAIVVTLVLAGGVVLVFGRQFLLAKYFSRGYVSDFKSKIIARIVGFIDESLAYRADAHMSLAEFQGCRLFNRRPDRFRGDDWVGGKVDATTIEFSEIHAEYKTESRDSKGRRRTHWHTIFKGLFFRCR